MKFLNGVLKKVALGTNFYKIDKTTVHAEIDAVRKIRVHEKKKRMKPLVLVSFRFSRSGKLKNAMPCYHCVAKLKKILPKKNYYIAKVIYSNSCGTLTTCYLDDLSIYITRKNKSCKR
jgi:hypothetical protein